MFSVLNPVKENFSTNASKQMHFWRTKITTHTKNVYLCGHNMTHLQLTVCKNIILFSKFGRCGGVTCTHVIVFQPVLLGRSPVLCRHCSNVTGSSHCSSAATNSKPRQSSNQSIGGTILYNEQGQVAHKLRHVIATVVHSYVYSELFSEKKKATVFYSQKAVILTCSYVLLMKKIVIPCYLNNTLVQI